MVRANAVQLRRVVVNLMTNASEAIPEEGGEITVRTSYVRREAGSVAINGAESSLTEAVLLEITDTGAGMTEDIQARIFDPFFTTKFDGRGLGLAAVQGIVRSHGGTIKVI